MLQSKSSVILSFDVEEHWRIEAAAGLIIGDEMKAHCRDRLIPSTSWLLDRLAERNIKATFFILGEIAKHTPQLIRAIHGAGHEVASHGWDHQRLHRLTPAMFRQDLRQSKHALEQVTGKAVVGYRAPTFSLVRETAWAIDVLVEEGFRYDSSIYPVRHDRYGVPAAPRAPFRLVGETNEIVELPPLTWRLLGMNVPVGGGGYFRLLPLWFLENALKQARKKCEPPVAMLYFHPWEFDLDQAELPLKWMNRFRTYIGTRRSGARLAALLHSHNFVRAIDVLASTVQDGRELPTFLLEVNRSANGEKQCLRIR